ncbi:MAG TPA: rod shape-determining protein MreC [Terriglobales bacterium]|nr:rod shape-determining protein MreC [Terriglobales bacterium]
MDNFIGRYRNLTILTAVLFAQVLGLGIQVRRPTDSGSQSLIRIWTVAAISPIEKAIVRVHEAVGDLWLSYVDLRGVRVENHALRSQLDRLRLEQARLEQEAAQGRRLGALLDFKQQFIGETVAARLIGSSGSRHSRVLYLDKGSEHGLRNGMAVISPQGIVGKITAVLPTSAQVLEIRDADSGVGVILEKSRLHAVLKGTTDGRTMLRYVMGDEKVEVGERLLTTGGDRIFPRGLPVGTVTSVGPGPDAFLAIVVEPAADLDRLEEVLVVTRVDQAPADVLEAEAPSRAAEILAQRLPGISPKPAAESSAQEPGPVSPADAPTAPAGEGSDAPSRPGATPASPPPGGASR